MSPSLGTRVPAPLPFTTDERASLLRAFGASGPALDELLAYGAPTFGEASAAAMPLPDEPCVATWRGWDAEARAAGAATALVRHVLALRFPVAAGMSERPDYRAVTRQGIAGCAPAVDDAPPFADPAGLRLFVHDTPAGAIPVIVAGARADFERLVRTFARRNEPSPVPPATGAMIVGGWPNWERVDAERRRWASAQGEGTRWDDPAALAALRPHPDRWQDRFILLSAGPYSAVPAECVGLAPDAWRALSLTIRLEHECAHYVTKRAFGSMRNALHDELLADYAGIVAATDRYRPDWALRFLGLAIEAGAVAAGSWSRRTVAVAPGGRLHSYRGTPPLGDAAFVVLARLAVAAVQALAAFDGALAVRTADGMAHQRRRPPMATRIAAIARLTLEELAAPDGARRLAAALATAQREYLGGENLGMVASAGTTTD